MTFGQYLVQRGIISQAAIEQALDLQKKPLKAIDRKYRRLASILLLISATDEDTLTEEFNRYNNFNNVYVSTTKYVNKEEFIKILKPEEQEKSETTILAIDHRRKRVLLGTISDSKQTLMKVQFLISQSLAGYKVEIKKLFEFPFRYWLKTSYSLIDTHFEPLDLKVSVEEKIKTMFRDAIESRTTDISIEAEHDASYVFFTIDTERVPIKKLRFTKDEAKEVSNWIIIQSGIAQNLAVQERIDCALPQLGNHKSHRARVNILRSYYGDTLNIRLLPNKPEFIDLEKLNYSKGIYDYMKYLCKPRKGLILMVGPTNSGKNTSLFSIISEFKRRFELKIVSIEQPVEYLIPGVQQINATTDNEYTEAVKSLVRQSPHVIYIAEIRDYVSMDTALGTSNTGKTVLSSMHVSNAYSVFTRSEEVYGSDISSKLISELTGVINQLLLPRACEECKVEITIDQINELYQEPLRKANYKGRIIHNTGKTSDGKVCPTCKGKGTKGIIPIAEYINFTEPLKRQLRLATTLAEKEDLLYKEMAKNNNFLLFDGLTNMDEGKCNIATLISKSVLDTVYTIKEVN